MRSVIGSIFTAVFTAEIANKLPEKLTSIVVPAVTSAGLPSSSVAALLSAVSVGTEDALRAVPGMNDDILTVASQSIAQAYAAAYTYPYYTGLALGLVSLIAALCIRDFDSHLTDHVSRQLYHKNDADKDILSLVDRTPTQDGEAVTETKQITKTSEGVA